MKTQLKLAERILPSPRLETFVGEITGYDAKQNCWVIDHHFQAQVAVSLMVKPEMRDKVSFIELEGNYIITQLLSRFAEQTHVTLQSDVNVHWIVPGLTIKAMENLELVALNKISVVGKNLVQSAVSSFIQQAENLIQQVNHLSSNAKGVMRLSGKQQVITAEEDVKIDGNRINMG